MSSNVAAFHLLAQLLSQFLSCQRIFTDQHQEFLAAPADTLTIISQQLPDDSCKTFQYRITGIMARPVVNLFEMIDIE